ncbi:MAG: hypothetical protein QNL04_02075 [SAR324 cluster bacterium]|nr:hypothetical protein [SAR324 cluster bacterium]
MTENVTLGLFLAICALLALSVIFSFVALIKGPNKLERMAATGQLGIIAVGFFLSFSFMHRAAYHVEPALVLMVTSLIGPMTIAKYMLERQRRIDERKHV